MTIYLLSAEGERGEADRVERRLRTALPDLLRIGSIEEIIDVAPHAGAPAYVLFVAPAQGRGYFRILLDTAGRHRHRLSFILLSGEISVDDYKALVRTGGDWISLGADPSEIHDIIARQEARSRYETGGAGPGARKPLAVALVSSAGGAGNATIAVETAAYLKTAKSTRGRDVCIVDLDFQSSHVCDHLDIEPRLQIAEISRNPERLDAQLFEIFVSRHASGLHVFAAPRGKFDCCELNVAALDAFFNLVSARYDLILIDLPPTWFAWTDAIVSACDGVLVTGLNTIPGLRRMVDTVGAVRAAANVSAQVAVIANRCQRRLVGGIARRQHVESVLGGERLFYLGEERDALESINTGVPLVLSKSRRHAFVKEIATIAGFCAELKSSRVTQDAAGGSLAIAR